ncbi:MAG: hypothetical protein J6U54_06240 [Clostridiales bacterium]|nr:hypothetical protein [Clostridiales bacterium]
MNKAIKIALNILFGTGVGAAGYFVGYKHGEKKTKEWACAEINSILADKNKEIDILQSEQIADLEKLTPDILAQLEHGKEDEVVIEDKPEPITPAPLNTQEIEIPDPIPAKKATRKKPRKTPFMITVDEFDEGSDDFDRVDLSIDQYGDLYDDESDDLYQYPEFVGNDLVKRMLKDIEFGDAKEWYVKNEAMNTVYDITYRITRPV